MLCLRARCRCCEESFSQTLIWEHTSLIEALVTPYAIFSSAPPREGGGGKEEEIVRGSAGT